MIVMKRKDKIQNYECINEIIIHPKIKTEREFLIFLRRGKVEESELLYDELQTQTVE